jgi:uncharacterized protein (TIGR03435 family)
LKLTFTPTSRQPQMAGPADAPPAAEPAPSDAAGPTIFTALQEQLGLRLESQKGPVEIIVIDNIERPTAN